MFKLFLRVPAMADSGMLAREASCRRLEGMKHAPAQSGRQSADPESPAARAPSPGAGRGGGERRNRAADRRRKIFRALHDCIIEKGYSNTTLAHIAQTAGMSPSHLLYYFQGKERILEAYFADVADWFLRRLADIAREPPGEQVERLASLWFGEGETAYADIGFMLECFGEAVHDGVMRETKSNFDQAWKGYLENLFPECSLREPLSAREAAEISYALLIGLRNSVYFDDSMSPGAAAYCFRRGIENLKRSPAEVTPPPGRP